ncbi:MAG: hypothetical protein IRY97_01835 [Thermomicrobiaceae bacterium]|nr:hypothetical protein [Thermomicrobiaceae bacterium]
MQNPLSWHYLTAPYWETPVWGPLSIAYLVVFVLGFIVSLGLYYDVLKLSRKNPPLHQAVRRAAPPALTIFAVGLIFFTFRALHVSAWGLHMRIWLYLTALALAIYAAYWIRYARTVYPAQVKAYQARLLKERYLRPAVAGGSGSMNGRRPGRKGSGRSKRRKRS